MLVGAWVRNRTSFPRSRSAQSGKVRPNLDEVIMWALAQSRSTRVSGWLPRGQVPARTHSSKSSARSITLSAGWKMCSRSKWSGLKDCSKRCGRSAKIRRIQKLIERSMKSSNLSSSRTLMIHFCLMQRSLRSLLSTRIFLPSPATPTLSTPPNVSRRSTL